MDTAWICEGCGDWIPGRDVHADRGTHDRTAPDEHDIDVAVECGPCTCDQGFVEADGCVHVVAQALGEDEA